MKIVLDTNVLLVSFSSRSRFYPIYEAFLEGEIQLCVTTEILLEYLEQLAIRVGLENASNVVSAISTAPDTVLVTKYFQWNLIAADPDDDKFVDCAVAAGVDFIVTNDGHFKILKTVPFPKVDVISADDLLGFLLPPSIGEIGSPWFTPRS